MSYSSESPEQGDYTKNDNIHNNNRISRKDFLKLLGSGDALLPLADLLDY
jgi:hypothetical protein